MSVRIAFQMIGNTKRIIKKHRSSRNRVIRIGVTLTETLWNASKSAKRICVDREFRSIFLMQLLNAKNVHQTTPLTYMNRYPTIFSACRDYFHGKKDLKILSYGCSTGEEVLTLRQYFPSAYIIGAEINKSSLAKCRKLPVDNKVTFIYSTDNEIQKNGPYDAIFCMAVLQRKPHFIIDKGITSLKKIYPFEKFEEQVVKFDQNVKQNGLLILHYSQYSLIDTSIASKYIALGEYNQNDYLSPVFDKNSNIKINPPVQNSIFIKMVE